MKVNVYYGGRGLLEDPTLFVVEEIIQVLQELRVEVTRYNMYEDKSGIATLPNTLKDCDGVILAASLEWFGIGGYMQQFLDMCWLYGDKEKIASLYMMPVVVATAYGEQDAELSLRKAWDVLGGISEPGIATYVDSTDVLEQESQYLNLIEKKAEDFYRLINKKTRKLPTSNTAVKNTLIKQNNINLTPQESEQLSKYVSDDSYVKKQKEDIEELASMFKDMLGKNPQPQDAFMKDFQRHFTPQHDFAARYLFMIDGMKEPLFIAVKDDKLEISYGKQENIDVIAKLSDQVLESIVEGRMTFQRAFMTGEMTAKGNFKTLRMLDTMFNFV